MILNLLFWFLLFVVWYTYVGYAVLLWLFVQLKRIFSPSQTTSRKQNEKPEVCLFITAFNEQDFVAQKVENSFALDYPKKKVQYVWVTDGSDDGTQELLGTYAELDVYHKPERKGKMHAMNRGMKFVKAPIVIFSDANTLLGINTIREIVAAFADKQVGCVAGEKRIVSKTNAAAASAGEGLYWKMESFIKKMDSELNTAVGAVGELFAIRTELFEELEQDTLLDDFMISLRIAQKGYKIAYAPNAYAEESASLNMREELKRKIRIAAGGVQIISRLSSLLNPFKHGILAWQYFSHKVLRWTLAPISLFLLFFVNFALLYQQQNWSLNNFYAMFFYLQVLCYFVAFLGSYFSNKEIRMKLFFVPYYFMLINYASVCGMVRYFKGKQSVTWEKSKRERR